MVYPEDQPKFQTGDDRYRQLLSERNLNLQFGLDDYLLYAQAPVADSLTPVIRSAQIPSGQLGAETLLGNGLKNLGWLGEGLNGSLALKKTTVRGHDYIYLPITFYWQQTQLTDRHSEISLRLIGADGRSYEKLYPLAPLEPQSEWLNSEIVATQHRFLIPRTFRNAPFQAELEIVDSDGRLVADGFRSIAPQYRSRTVAGTLLLGLIEPNAGFAD